MVSDAVLQQLHFGAHAVSTILTGFLTYWVVAHTELSIKRWFGLWMGNFAVWSAVATALTVVTFQPLAYLLFVGWLFSGLSAIVLTILFTTVYTGRNPLNSRLCRASGVVYSLLTVLLFTGPFHTLYWRSVSFLRTPFPHVSVEYGVGWLATVLFGIVAVFTSVYYFAELHFRSRRQQRRVAMVLAVGGFLGLLPLPLSHLDLFLVPTYNYYAFTGTTYGLVVGYAAIRFGTDTLSVLAREEALDRLVDPYIALDTQYRIVDFNHASSELSDDLTADRLGAPLENVFPTVADAVITPTGATVPDEPITFVADGRRRYYSVAVSTVSDWRSTTGYAVVLNDVTELERSRHQVQQQNEQLDAFVGTVSHDLRNPLSVIAGRLQLAQSECDSEHLDSIDRARGRMEALIDDLLTLAREGEAVGDREPVALAALVDNCWHTVDTKAATLHTETTRTISADRSRLRQLLENLLRNAVDHGSEDVTITVGDCEAGFYVEDDGPGIPESDRETVFDAGYSTDRDGTGFGLAIVTRIVEAHGWEISVVEGSTGGARFEITGVERAENPSPEGPPSTTT